jgi:hypothetical protein
MVRGASAEFKFNLTCDFEDLDIAEVTFWQNGNYGPASNRPLPIQKVLAQCEQGDHARQLKVTLNQEETLRFSDKRKACTQLKGKTKGGTPVVSQEHMVIVYPVKNDSILDDEVLPTPAWDGFVYLDGGYIID